MIEGQIFHPSCFKCSSCNGKLSAGKFAKAPDGKYYCKVHYEQMFKLRGRYSVSGETAPRPPGSDQAAACDGAASKGQDAAGDAAAAVDQDAAGDAAAAVGQDAAGDAAAAVEAPEDPSQET